MATFGPADGAALSSIRNLNQVRGQLQSSLERLSSGYKINKGSDDAAALAISEGLRADIRSLSQAQRNISTGVNLAQTAEGGLSQIGEMTLRLRELAVQGANGALSTEQRGAINTEATQIKSEIDRIAGTTEFNGQKLLDGSATGIEIQAGANANETISVSVASSTASSLGLSGVDLSSQAGAQNALAAIDNALKNVSSSRANLGALENRFDAASNNMGIAIENISAADSRIRDTDVAEESSRLVRSQIQTQFSTSVAMQANMSSQSILRLLG